jgi:DNA-binding CsgD family transcriptional regulator
MGDYARAQLLYERAVEGRRELGEPWGLAFALVGLAGVLLDMGDFVHARTTLEETIGTSYERGDRHGLTVALEAFAGLAALTNQPEQALRLVGAAEELRERHQFPLSPAGRVQLDRWLEATSHEISENTAAAMRSAGRALAEDDAVALARATAGAGSRSVGDHPGAVSTHERVLTPREHQVALLVGEGLSNRQIAKRLVITERTAGAHIEHILHKLGYSTRTQIGVWAAAKDGPALQSS